MPNAFFLKTLKYRKIPVISLGLIYNFVRGFGWAYKRRGLYPGVGGGGGGGGGFISGIKFSPVQNCHPAEGAYNRMYVSVPR